MKNLVAESLCLGHEGSVSQALDCCVGVQLPVVHHSDGTQLERAIADYIRRNNQTPKPLAWTKSAERILQKVNRGKALLETLH